LHEQRKLAVNTRPTSPPESLVMLQAFSRMLPDTVEVWRNHGAPRIARDGSDYILAWEEHFGRNIVPWRMTVAVQQIRRRRTPCCFEIRQRGRRRF